nr:hypothetical protein [Tanacetum cinerariifolium]
MLKRLHLRNFTVFADAEFEFGDGLNVLVGTNGTGKTHVLKLGYAAEMSRDNVNRAAAVAGPIMDLTPQIGVSLLWTTALYNLLREVFLPGKLGHLIKRGIEGSAEVDISFEEKPLEKLAFQINPKNEAAGRSESSLKVREQTPSIDTKAVENAVFIPAKEVLTQGWLPSLYNRREISVDRTYPDVIQLLMGPTLRSPEPAHIVEKLAQLIGGKVEEEGGHFYLAAPDQPRLEMNLVAEGMRKFATLYKLLANGTLTPETTLFWDEPEANLNPALLKEMAAMLTDLAQAGFQIILATHSLFLMKELHILSRQRKQATRYFGLYKGEKGDVRVEKQDDFMQLQHIAALDAELAQTFDFDEAKLEKIDGLKGVDIVAGIRPMFHTLTLLEIKDFRQHAHALKEEIRLGTLVLEIVQKAVHTCGGLYLGARSNDALLDVELRAAPARPATAQSTVPAAECGHPTRGCGPPARRGPCATILPMLLWRAARPRARWPKGRPGRAAAAAAPVPGCAPLRGRRLPGAAGAARLAALGAVAGGALAPAGRVGAGRAAGCRRAGRPGCLRPRASARAAAAFAPESWSGLERWPAHRQQQARRLGVRPNPAAHPPSKRSRW